MEETDIIHARDETQGQDLVLSWEQVHADTLSLAERLSEKGPWTGIIAVTRGGLVPAGLLSRALDLCAIETACIVSYDSSDIKYRGDSRVIRFPQCEDGGKGWLVVDDLVDTGETFRLVRGRLPKAFYACVYAKPGGAAQADAFEKTVPQETWIHFPWEQV